MKIAEVFWICWGLHWFQWLVHAFGRNQNFRLHPKQWVLSHLSCVDKRNLVFKGFHLLFAGNLIMVQITLYPVLNYKQIYDL